MKSRVTDSRERSPEVLNKPSESTFEFDSDSGVDDMYASIANRSGTHGRMATYQRIANPFTLKAGTTAKLDALSNGPVAQMMWMSQETGFEISDADWDELEDLINKYDVDVGDIDKGSDSKSLDDGQIKIGVALTDLKAKLLSLAGNHEKKAEKCWNSFIGTGVKRQPNHKGGLWQAILIAESGTQCNNEMAAWMRNCLTSNFEHYEDE